MQGTDAQVVLPRVLAGAALAALVLAILVDAAGAAGVLPGWWPVASYVLVGAAVALATATVLVRVLRTRTGAQSRRWLTLLELLATGLLLGAWLLRGHHEIPPDPPLVGAQVMVAMLLGGAALRRWRT
jgi:hypothetical protein